MSSTEPIDEAVIRKLRTDYCDDDGSLLIGLIEAFVDEMRILQDAKQANDDGKSTVKLAQVAHRLKSAAATLGARTVVRLCQELEMADRAGDTTSASNTLVKLLPAIAHAHSALARVAKSAVANNGT